MSCIYYLIIFDLRLFVNSYQALNFIWWFLLFIHATNFNGCSILRKTETQDGWKSFSLCVRNHPLMRRCMWRFLARLQVSAYTPRYRHLCALLIKSSMDLLCYLYNSTMLLHSAHYSLISIWLLWVNFTMKFLCFIRDPPTMVLLTIA